jgi:hypothetical protein
VPSTRGSVALLVKLIAWFALSTVMDCWVWGAAL